MTSRLILDTGPWVALHCRDDAYHDWAKTQFGQYAGPFLTWEAVVAETCFLLARAGFDPGQALALIERGVVQIAISLADQAGAVRALFERSAVAVSGSECPAEPRWCPGLRLTVPLGGERPPPALRTGRAGAHCQNAAFLLPAVKSSGDTGRH